MERSPEAQYLTHLPPAGVRGPTARLFLALRDMPDETELGFGGRAIGAAQEGFMLTLSAMLVLISFALLLATTNYLGPARTPGRAQTSPAAVIMAAAEPVQSPGR